MKKKDIKQLGTLRICLDDYQENEWNESLDCEFALWGTESDETLTMEKYHMYCRHFAAALGFAESTINEWFGEY